MSEPITGGIKSAGPYHLSEEREEVAAILTSSCICIQIMTSSMCKN